MRWMYKYINDEKGKLEFELSLYILSTKLFRQLTLAFLEENHYLSFCSSFFR